MPDRDEGEGPNEYPGPGQIGQFFTGMLIGFSIGFAIGGTFAAIVFHG